MSLGLIAPVALGVSGPTYKAPTRLRFGFETVGGCGGANIKYIKDMGITIKKIVESFIDTIKSIRTSSENHDQKTNGSTKSFFRKDNEDVATSLFALKTYQSSGD
jgi:hypothetical protein